jgi:hypothetical protein
MSVASARDPSWIRETRLVGQVLEVCMVHRVPEGSVKYFLNHYPSEQRRPHYRFREGSGVVETTSFRTRRSRGNDILMARLQYA